MSMIKPPNELESRLMELFIKYSKQALINFWQLTQLPADDPGGDIIGQHKYASGAKQVIEELLIEFFGSEKEELIYLEAMINAKLEQSNYEM